MLVIHQKRNQILILAIVVAFAGAIAFGAYASATTTSIETTTSTATPIKHVVVIFQENVSFDHYFGTYPYALNPAGEPAFHAKTGTPSVNGLSGVLLTNNPNLVNPFRLDRSQEITCDQDHDYLPEQQAFNMGAMNKFVQYTGNNSTGCNPDTVMGYYDGNTVTGLWEYAQNFAMNDNFFDTVFGPSTPGALNLISGQTSGASPAIPGVVVNGTVIGDDDPAFDDCSSSPTITMTGTNIGDMMNSAGITWGWFEGGFAPTGHTAKGAAICGSSHINYGGANVTDYSPHHEPFQYYASTSNPHHLSPSSISMIGRTDQANHQYDLSSFWQAVYNGNMPAVSFLKAAKYQDGHAGYSDPLDEQNFLVNTINALEKTSYWSSTAIIITYDDSDGWYDHVMSPIVMQSSDPANDAILGSNLCGKVATGFPNDRCGYGERLPVLVISPYAKSNYVDNTLTDQTSILRFIEDNWGLGRTGSTSFDNYAGTLDNMFAFGNGATTPALFLNPITGLPVHDATVTAATH
jgi:phospholipase C